MPLNLLRRKPSHPQETKQGARKPVCRCPLCPSGRIYARQDGSLVCPDCGCSLPADSFTALLAESLN